MSTPYSEFLLYMSCHAETAEIENNDHMQLNINPCQDRSRNTTHVDIGCQRDNMIHSNNLGNLEPNDQYQYQPYGFTQHQDHSYYSQPSEPHPHSYHSKYSQYYTREHAEFHASTWKELKEAEKDIEKYLSIIGEHIRMEENQINSPPQNEIHPTTSINTQLHSTEFGYETSSNSTTQSVEPLLSPISHHLTSKTTIEPSEDIQLETFGRSDEDNTVDEEIEMESHTEENHHEDIISYGVEEHTPTRSSNFIPIRIDIGEYYSQIFVNDYSPETLPDELLADLYDSFTAEDSINMGSEEFSTAEELDNQLSDEQMTIESKECFRMPYIPSLHYILTYTSLSDEDIPDESSLPEEIEEVKVFVLAEVKQTIHFNSPVQKIGHIIILFCFNSLDMHQYYHLCLLMDAREPPGSHDK